MRGGLVGVGGVVHGGVDECTDDECAAAIINGLTRKLLRGVGINKNAEFDSKSLFEKLKTKHGIVNHNDKKTTRAEVHQMQQRREAARTKRIAKQKKQIKLAVALFIALVLGNIVGWWL